MTGETTADKLLQYIQTHPGLDDDELARHLKIKPRQTINQAARLLAQQGLLLRQIGPRGKIVNVAPKSAPVTAAKDKPSQQPHSSNDELSEDDVKKALERYLVKQNWALKIAWGKARGIDIEATKGPSRWLIECKGTGSRPPMFNNYFLGAIGELLQRMNDPSAKYSLAFPEHKKFRRLWDELPLHIKSKLGITALFISKSGGVSEEN